MTIKLGHPISDRASRALILFGKLGYLTQRQLCEFLFAGTTNTAESQRVMTSRVIKSLTSLKLVTVTARLIGGGVGGSAVGYYHLTSAGRRLAATFDETLPVEARRELRSSISHTITVAEVVLLFHKKATANPEHEISGWETERTLAPRLGRSPVIPDVHLVYATKTSEIEMAVEVDMDTERPKYFVAKIARYLDLLQHGSWRQAFEDWPVVLTITPSERRAIALAAAAERYLTGRADWPRLKSSVEFAFASLPCLASDGPFGHCWFVVGQLGQHALTTEVE